MLKSGITQYKSFFFVGIGGVSMSALAKILHLRGKRVAGYDRCDGEYTRALIELGIEVTLDINCNIEEYDCVVYTDAIPSSNKILKMAEALKKPTFSRGEFLGQFCKLFNSVLAVAGCHGKTTCTAMLTHVFNASGYGFTSHIGGTDLQFTNVFYKGSEVFITEACEYRRNFLNLQPSVGVILNSDRDHPDCYSNEEELKSAYDEFGQNSQNLVRLYGDGDNKCTTFGYDDRADYFAKNIRSSGGKYSFTVYEKGEEMGRVSLNVFGKHNVLNALAAIAAARIYRISFNKIAEGLFAFGGVKRRFENIGTINGAVCIADYAHHPNEIKASLKTARSIAKGNIYVVFQPHTYSRTKCLFKQFTSVLSPVKRLLVYKTFPAREYYDDAGSALQLSNSLRRSRYADCPDDIIRFTRSVGEGDVILFLGAGDIYEIAKSVIKRVGLK